MNKRSVYKLSCGFHSLDLGIRTRIMGILNVTPDSFSDGGQYFTLENAIAHGEKLVSDGADILDIGGESTRPFSSPVPAEEEIRRVVPVIEKLVPRIRIPISIDTTKAEVAKKAVEAGAAIINDIGSFQLDPAMADIAAQYKVPVIFMHMQGTPRTMQISPDYADVIGDIKGFLERTVADAEKRGIPRSRIIIDPGIGFGKTIDHNLLIIKRLIELQSLDQPLLIGVSRKSFIQKILSHPSENDLSPSSHDVAASVDVEGGTQAAIAAAICNGAHIVRVHDVASTRTTVKLMDAILNAE